jgi:two-component system sensor histidine kinase FlrB
VTCIESDAADLARAFESFNALSTQLRTTYAALQTKVEALTGEVEHARREREREARKSERLAERLKLLLATLPAGVVVVDADGLVTDTNPAADLILGPGHAGEAWHGVARSTFRHQLGPSGDWIRHDGRRVSLAVSTIAEEGSKIVLLTDVSETRSIEELVNRNQRLSAMGKMAASLAHQIRTPLAGALLYFSQSAKRATDSTQTDLIARGIERLRHLDHLVRDMLVFARGNGPGERVRVADLFRDVDAAVRGIKPPEAHLIIDGQDVLVELDGNRTALTAALTNLVSNALETKPDVVVTLKAAVRGSRVEFTVHDNGPGIAKEIQSRVFEPFFSTRPAGTGLGLAVVKTVTDAHGGALAMDSSPDHGTRIGIDLPRQAGASPEFARGVA